MSKIEFSRKFNDLMCAKLEALENLDYDAFLKKTDDFEFVLSLVYFVLSKEKIILKDKNNKSRLERLTKRVSTIDMDLVFDSTFSEQLPNIISSDENAHVWVLDNIRDSIMHGAFEIDEEKQLLLLDNKQHDRKFKAEIPFSWIVKYAKYDILSKRIMDKYTVQGFYYDTSKQSCKYLRTNKEMMSHILYNVNVMGSKFNVKLIKGRIKEIFEEYQNKDIDDKIIEQYSESFNFEQLKYNKKYLVSFYVASEAVKNQIETEFPGVSVDININNRKYKTVNKLSKKLASYYNNYDLFYQQINDILRHKSDGILAGISNLITLLDYNFEYGREFSIYDRLNFVQYMAEGDLKKYDKINDIYAVFERGINKLRCAALYVYGVATLVFGYNDFYKSYFTEKKPTDYRFMVVTLKKYLECAAAEKKKSMELLESEIKLFEQKENLAKCSSPSGIEHLNNSIESISKDIEKTKKELSELTYKPYVDRYKIDQEKINKIDESLTVYFNHFHRAKNKTDKRKIKKIIGQMYDRKIEEESRYKFGVSDSMNDALQVIRNSLSHGGRLYVGKNNGFNTTIVFNDYESDNKRSGMVVCKYCDLIEMLNEPYRVNKIVNENRVKVLKK